MPGIRPGDDHAARAFFHAAGKPYRAATALELGYAPDRPEAGDTALLLSISGSTRRTVEAAGRLRRRGVRVIAVTCERESDLARRADGVIVLPYRPISRKTPHTVDYMISLLALACVALRDDPDQAAELERIPTLLENATPGAMGVAEGLARSLERNARFFFLAGPMDQGVAEYGAAKLHEAGGWTALAAESENFVHGMNFMLEPADLVVTIAGPYEDAFRAREVADALPELCAHCTVDSAAPRVNPGSFAFAATAPVLHPFQASLALQCLCLGLAERYCPDVELPRSGFPRGDEHARVQSKLMKTTAVRHTRQ